MDVVETRTEVKAVHRAQKDQPIIDEQQYLFIKRMLDILMSLFGLLLLLPVFAVIALAILIENPRGNAIFRQSLVGPRPPLPREVLEYTPYEMARLVEMDLQYIAWRSLGMDLRIIGRTILTLLAKNGY
ncbi:MAG: sugar transferase [Paenibacillaceae bacterium]